VRQVAQLRGQADLNVAFVGLGEVEEARRFAERTGTSAPIVCDPNGELYRAFGLERAGIRQMMNRNEMRRAAEAMRLGYRGSRSRGDKRQLGGVFVIDRQGRVAWSERSTSPSEAPATDRIRAALKEANGGG
jgi:peroxiredoxin